MARTKKTAVIDPNAVNIADFCQSQGINEQIFRLELMQYQEDADSTKTCDFSVAQSVASTIAATSKTLPETTTTAETITPSALQPAPETATEVCDQPQNSLQVANTPSTPVVPTQGQNTPIPTALDELIASAEDDINLADLVLVYRNQQIAANTQARDGELVASLRERRLERRNQVFDHIRDLNGRQPIAPELPELPASLSDEIKVLSDELGKSLSIG